MRMTITLALVALAAYGGWRFGKAAAALDAVTIPPLADHSDDSPDAWRFVDVPDTAAMGDGPRVWW